MESVGASILLGNVCVCIERREQVRWNVHSGESWVRGMQMSTVRCANVPVG